MYPTKKVLSEYGYQDYCVYFKDSERKVHALETSRSNNNCNEPIFIYSKYPNTFRVASYNVHNFINLCDHIKPARNVKAICNLIEKTKSDIVLLQEVIPTSEKLLEENIQSKKELNKLSFKKFINKMEENGYIYNVISNTMDEVSYYKFEDNCYYVLANAIFSKVPLKNIKTTFITGNRNVITAEVEIENQNVLIACTHLEFSNYRHNIEKFGSENIIKAQAEKLVEILKEESKSRNTDKIILGGDLNNDTGHPDLEIIFDYFKQKIVRKRKNIFNRNNIKKDYLLIKNIESLGEQEIVSSYSDHNLIFNDFTSKKIDILKKKTKFQILNKKNFMDYASIIQKINPEKKIEFLSHHISDEMIENVHLNYPEWYATDNIKPLYSKVKKFDYSTPLKVLYQTYKNNRYKELYYEANKLCGKEIGSDMDNMTEEILFHYIKCRPKMKTLILWPRSEWTYDKKRLKKTMNLLKEKGIVYYTKTLNLDYKQGANLVFHLYLTTNRNKNTNHINYNTEAKGWNKNRTNKNRTNKNRNNNKKKVMVLFYEYGGNQSDISGSDAFFKTEIRNIWLTDSKRPYDILHINDFYSETIDNSSLFLNENSLKVLKTGNVFSVAYHTNEEVCSQINSYKKILSNKFSLLEQERFILTSSFVLFTYGVRKFKDLDGMVMSKPEPNDKFKEIYNQYFDIEGKNYQPYIDITMKGTRLYEPYITKFKDKIAKIIGADTFDDMIMDPKYHYYYFGIKTIILPFELIQKAHRFRPKSFVDIIMTGELINKKYKLPFIPEIFEFEHYYTDNMTRNKLISIMLYYCQQLYKKKDFKKEKLNKYLTNFAITDNVYESNIKQDRKVYFHKLGYASGFDFLRKLECDKSSPTKKNIKVINNASNKMSRKKNDF